MVVSETHFSKALSPRLVSATGSWMAVSVVHSSKQLSPMVRMETGSEMVRSEWQKRNTLLSNFSMNPCT